MWRQKLLNNNKQALSTAIEGWIYTAKADIGFRLKESTNNDQASYAYDHLDIVNKDALTEIERINNTTDRTITHASPSDVAILGCGPVGMAMALHLKKREPNSSIYIYERRLSRDGKVIAPFDRRWLTHLELGLISQAITEQDLNLIKKISLEGRVGIDIRNLEYMLLRAIKENNIKIANSKEYEYNSEYLIDATGGRFLRQDQGKAKIIGNINLNNAKNKLLDTGKFLQNIPKHSLRLAQEGNTVFPIFGERRLRFGYLKLNYIDPTMRKDFINFAHSMGDFGIYFWSGEMRCHNNRALVFITLTEKEYFILSSYIRKPTYIKTLMQSESISSCKNISDRILNLIGFIDKHSECNSAIVEPPFQWKPYFVLRSDIQVNSTKYVNIGDSFFNGNPMVGNGLGFHLYEINNVFN